MDGNGRWATLKGMPRWKGHREGVKRVKEVTEASAELGIGVLSLYAFSTENWNRPKKEVELLMMLLEEYLERELPTMMKQNIRLSAMGRLHRLPESTQNKLKDTMKITSSNTGMVLNIALSYGGQAEIADACRKIAEKVKKGRLSPEEIETPHSQKEEEEEHHLPQRYCLAPVQHETTTPLPKPSLPSPQSGRRQRPPPD
jgi:undecaprenyl diphosphate synthase